MSRTDPKGLNMITTDSTVEATLKVFRLLLWNEGYTQLSWTSAGLGQPVCSVKVRKDGLAASAAPQALQRLLDDVRWESGNWLFDLELGLLHQVEAVWVVVDGPPLLEAEGPNHRRCPQCAAWMTHIGGGFYVCAACAPAPGTWAYMHRIEQPWLEGPISARWGAMHT